MRKDSGMVQVLRQLWPRLVVQYRARIYLGHYMLSGKRGEM